MSNTISVRIEPVQAWAASGQMNHDFRKASSTPQYVNTELSANNSYILEPLPTAKLRADLGNRRKEAHQQNLRQDCRIAISGLISFGTEAQPIINEMSIEKQDELYKKVAEAISEKSGHQLIGLAVHRDEASPHAHFMLLGYREQERTKEITVKIDGQKVKQEVHVTEYVPWNLEKSDLRKLQDVAAKCVEHLGIKRGTPIEEHLENGEPLQKVIHKSVRELHLSLPKELENLRAKISEQEAIVAMNAAKISEQEKILAKNDDSIGEQESVLAKNAYLISEQEAVIAKNDDSIKEQEVMLTNISEEISEQEDKLKKNEDKINEQEVVIAKSEEKIGELKEILKKNEDKISAQEETMSRNYARIKEQVETIEGYRYEYEQAKAWRNQYREDGMPTRPESQTIREKAGLVSSKPIDVVYKEDMTVFASRMELWATKKLSIKDEIINKKENEIKSLYRQKAEETNNKEIASKMLWKVCEAIADSPDAKAILKKVPEIEQIVVMKNPNINVQSKQKNLVSSGGLTL
jgi:hypothetical protein